MVCGDDDEDDYDDDEDVKTVSWGAMDVSTGR